MYDAANRATVEQAYRVTVGALKRKGESVPIGGEHTDFSAKIQNERWIGRGILSWRTKCGYDVARALFSIAVDQSGTTTAAFTIGQTVSVVAITFTRSKFGARPWFACPGCHRRADALYISRERFACRICLRLTYPSQRSNMRRFWAGLAKRTGVQSRFIRNQLAAAGRMVMLNRGLSPIPGST